MQTIIEQAQPYITAIVSAIIGVLVTVILRSIALLRIKADSWFDARLSVQQRDLLHKIATEGFAYAQTVFRDMEGEAKLSQALEYTAVELDKRGITIAPEAIRAAVEDAYLKYKATVLTKQ